MASTILLAVCMSLVILESKHVQGIQQPPYIRYQPEDQTVQKGHPVRLNCYVMGHPLPNVTWYKDGLPIKLASKPYISVLPNHTLVIQNPVHNSKRKDGGTYYCVAKNLAGVEQSRNATVIVPFLDSVFLKSPQSATIFQTKQQKFQCIPPRGYPRPVVVEWRKNGIPLFRIDSQKKVKKYKGRWIVSQEDNIYTLSFWVTLESAGVYTCVAQNSDGIRMSAPAQLTVKVIPPEVSMAALTEAYVGTTGQLHCKIAVPLPVPERIWSKVNGKMPSGNRVKETDDGKLIISNLMESDSGTYKCLTRNKAGEKPVRGRLMVYKKPVYVIQPTSVKIPIGGKAKFECKAQYGKNILIKYRFNDKWYSKREAGSGGRVYVNNNDELIIENARLSDSPKVVQCFIHDDFSMIATDNLFLTVLNTTISPPSITLTPRKATVVEGDHMTLTCTASGVGNLIFRWISASDGLEFTDQMKGLSITPFAFGSNFTINNALASDGRAYRCKVTGEGGSQSLISMVTVKPTVGKAPGPVPYVYVRNVQSTSVVLIWGHPHTKLLSPVTSYMIEIKNVKKGSSEKITVRKEPTTKKIEDLEPSNVYVFSVMAVNQFGESLSKESPNTETLAIRHTTFAPKSGGYVDKLLDVMLRLTTGMIRVDSITVYWNPLDPNRITSYALFYKKTTDSRFKSIEINDTMISSYMIGGLSAFTEYEIKIQVYNHGYESHFSSILVAKTKKQVSIPPPIEVGIVKIDNLNLEVYWSPPDGFHNMEGVQGYQLSCLNADKSPFFVGGVNKQAKRYLLSGLDTYEQYTVNVAIKTKHGIGNSSKSFSFVLGNMKNGEVMGVYPRDRTHLKMKDGKEENSILEVIKQPWFIGMIGTLIWLFFLVIVIFLCWRRMKRRRQIKRYNESTRGLIPGNRTLDTVDSSLSRTRWAESATTYEPTHPRRTFCCCCRNKTDSFDEDFPNRADIKPLMTYTRHESVEQRPKGTNADMNMLKENNTAIAMKNGYMVGMPLNNEINLNSRPQQDSGDECNRLKNRLAASQDLTPSIHSGTGSRCDPRAKTDSVERRHAEIVRTAANKSFPDAELVNVMETNPQASWKREKPKDSPKVIQKPPGENTLLRQGKGQFKPVPQLEVLNWADGLPNSDPLTNEGSQTSGPSSPKLSSSASIFSEGIDTRPDSRMSHAGSGSSLNRYPFEKRRRKTSNASSMLSSELYQSEMDPSCYSDVVSERKRKKDKAIPPPIDLEGLTSDILLQWAESVTNSSPSSSGSSSPSRLSGISSEGSIYTDEDFAQAVAAVAECGGFNMDYDYSLPTTQPPFQSSRNAKMNKIDEALLQRSKLRNNPGVGNPSKFHDPHQGASNAFFPQISMSSYLTGTGKGPPSSYSGQSGIPRSQHHRKRSNPAEKNLRYGTGFQDVDSVSSVSSKPLTVSNLMEHDSSLGRDKKESTKPLTVSNLLQHDSSLDRPHNHKQSERLPREAPPAYSEGHSINNTNLLMPEAPLSLISALERNESINSNSKDSGNSSSRQDSEVENGGTSERIPVPKKHLATGKIYANSMEYPHC